MRKARPREKLVFRKGRKAMGKNIKVLMVDDEERFRETTGKMLSKKGYETVMVGSGEEAVEALRMEPADVVVLDIRMPGMDGHQALSEIKRIRPETQVIMLTGHGNLDSAKEALVRGAFDYLNKPCNIDVLAAKIDQAYAAGSKEVRRRELTVGDVMIRIEDYSTVDEESTVRDALRQLLASFEGLMASNRVMETGHRSLLVFDRKGELAGILSIRDLLGALRPAYLTAPRPSLADSVRYSPMFWTGLFTTQARNLSAKKVGDIMSEAPMEVEENANLMEVADLMYREGQRRLVVKSKDKVVGIVREQDLFFELVRIVL